MRIFAALTTALVLISLPAAAADDPKNAVEYRQAVMKSLGGHAGAIAKIVKGQASHPGHIPEHAEAIAVTSELVADIFPENSGPNDYADTAALPAVWEKPDAFRKTVDDFVAAAQDFAEAAQSDDRQTILAGFKKLGGACGACHDDFRKEQE